MEKLEFESIIQTYIEQHIHCSSDAKPHIIVALSGGADSVALLKVLINLGYPCTAAHCNFHLRGDESERDEKFVRDLCNLQNTELFTIDFDALQYAKDNKISIEMACRELRYNWFEEIRKQVKAAYVAVAHHKNDNIETFFLNAFRGTGIKGLAGMRPRHKYIIRPLLCVNRGDIENYLADSAQDYVTDSTNLANVFLRNKIRNVVIPTIKREFPNSIQNLNTTINHLGEERDLFMQLLEKFKQEISMPRNDSESVAISVQKLSPENWGNAYETLIYELFKEYGFNRNQCDDIARIIKENRLSGQTFYCSSYALSLYDEYIVLENNTNVDSQIYNIEINKPDTMPPMLVCKRVQGEPFSCSVCDGRTTVAFSPDLVKVHNLKLRHWERGDRFKPFGLHASKLLSDLFTDQKLTQIQKRKVWVLVADGVIIWVLGLRSSDSFAVPSNSNDYFVLSYINSI